MSKLIVLFLVIAVAISCVTSFGLFNKGPMRKQVTRLNTFYDRQSGPNKGSSNKPDPKQKKDVGNKWNAQMKSAFTQSSQRTCQDELQDLSLDTEGKDFSAQTALGSRLSQKLREKSSAMQAEMDENEAHSVKNYFKDLFGSK